MGENLELFVTYNYCVNFVVALNWCVTKRSKTNKNDLLTNYKGLFLCGEFIQLLYWTTVKNNYKDAYNEKAVDWIGVYSGIN